MIQYDKIRNEVKANINSVGNEESTFNTDSLKRDELSLDAFIAFPLSQIALEAEDDNPFADLADDITDNQDSDSEDSNDNVFDDNDDDPFSSDSDDPFGSDSEEDKKKQVSPILDREDATNDKFDLSKIIRKDFPGFIYSLQDVIKNSITILEKQNLDSDLQQTKEKVLFQYREVLKSVEEYISVIDNEKYEDIFMMYVQFWTVLNKLKETTEKIMM